MRGNAWDDKLPSEKQALSRGDSGKEGRVRSERATHLVLEQVWYER